MTTSTLADYGPDQPLDLAARVVTVAADGEARGRCSWARDPVTDRWYPLGRSGSYNWWALRHLFPDATVTLPEPQAGRTIPSRRTDPDTSKQAAANIHVRAGTQRANLLLAFGYKAELTPDNPGLTDEQAMARADNVSPQSEYAKRCSELREAGLIEPTGETRRGRAGQDRIVSRITDAGRRVVERLNA